MMVDPIALKVIVRDLLRVEEDYRSALPGAPVRTDSGRRSRWRRRRGSRSVPGIRVTPPAHRNQAEDTIRRALSNGPRSAAALAQSTGMSFAAVLIGLEAMEAAGVVARTARGVVQLNTAPTNASCPERPVGLPCAATTAHPSV
jgi:predicted Rossmann fold nucleotide-binding protein DprA/Smf involved in DNA uptake